MKRKVIGLKTKVVLFCAALCALLFSGCGLVSPAGITGAEEEYTVSEGMTRVTLYLDGGSKAPDPGVITWGTLTVSGGGMDTISLEVGGGTTTLEVPSGPMREFSLTAQTSSARYRGTTVVTLNPGTAQTVTIPMGLEHTAIVVPDYNNFRIVQVDDIEGTGWLSYTPGPNIEPIDTDIDRDGRLYMLYTEFGGENYNVQYIEDFTGEASGPDWVPVEIPFPMGFVDMAVDPVNGDVWIVTQDTGTHIEVSPILTRTTLGGTSVSLYLDEYVFSNLPDLMNCEFISFKPLGAGLVAVHYAYMSSGQEEYHVLEVFDLSAGAWTSVDAYRETGSLGSLAGLIEYRWENYSRSFGINFAQDMIVLYGAGAWTDRSAVRSLVFGFNNNELSGPAVYTADLPYANDENYFFIEPFFNGTLAPLFRVSYEYGAAAPVQADAVFMYDSPAFTLPPRVYGGDKGSGVGQFDFFTAQLIQ